jgi:putative nucleotidyltransferase with HDIG domain
MKTATFNRYYKGAALCAQKNMIEDVKYLSESSKRRMIKNKEIWLGYAKCLGIILVAVFTTTLFSLYMTGNFKGAFSHDYALATAGRFISNFLLMSSLYFGAFSYSEKKTAAVRDFCLILIVLSITYIACMATANLLNVYALPIALVTLVVVELLGKKQAMLSTIVLAVMIMLSFLFNEHMSDRVIGLVVASVICNGISAVLINMFTNSHFARLKFLLASLAASALSQPFVVAMTLAGHDFTINLLWNVLWSYGSNIAAILVFMPLVAMFEGIFNIADDFRLNELSNLNHPLLKKLASEAPGTFNHSLSVGNLAEACASAIDENPNLARCAAYYHDIGKLKAPLYFSENQSDYNPHDELIPEVSVSMITSHTLFGEILAKQYRLPLEISAVCKEHHGTAPVGYFYRKAQNYLEDGSVAVDNYTYPGPKPQSKVSAIIMICDTVEAALRSFMPDNKGDIEKRIDKLVDEKLALGQFDECPITMQDIAVIKRTILEVLPGIYHGRVSYENVKKA